MGMSYFAPQAYTKETLAEAFEWLKKQPPHVRQFTKSADELVSLYLNSQKQDGRVSESFIKDLAGLAKDLEAFEGEKKANNLPPKNEPAPTVTEPAKPAIKPLPSLKLDSRSQEFVSQTKSRFNLSSDEEAIRMLLAIGYEKILSL